MTGIPELQVLGVIADGLEAVRKADELRPDLIIMDIGLPRLNGLEATKQILRLVPQCRVLFLTQESSADVAQEAFRLGAWAYITKEQIATELPHAIRATLNGKRFIGSGIIVGASGLRTLQVKAPSNFDRPPAPLRNQGSQVVSFEIYSDENLLLEGGFRFIEAALQNGESVLVIACEALQVSVYQKVQSHGIDISAAVKSGNYTAIDAREMSPLFTMDDMRPSIYSAAILSLSGSQQECLVIACSRRC